MICITIAQESRRLAPVDMLNASRQCNLLEIRLDYFLKDVDVAELRAASPHPVIVTCRRKQDGGRWDRSESERLALLRHCMQAGVEYVEVELDVADQVPAQGTTKRIISYTDLTGTPTNIAAIYAQIRQHNPDVVKLTTMARTPEEAWPVARLLVKSETPIVAVGLGKGGMMLGLLGARVGAPWVYAALERGMESYPDQPTITELKEVYHYPSISRSTRMIAVVGASDRDRATISALNRAFSTLELPMRCLPMGLGNLQLFRKAMDALKVTGAIVPSEVRGDILEMTTELDPSAERVGSADLLLPGKNGWRGHDTQAAGAVVALESAILARTPQRPLSKQFVMLVNTNALARAIAAELKQRGCGLIITSREQEEAQEMARKLGCRYVRFEALYTTLHDVLIVCEEEKDRTTTGGKHLNVHPGYLRPGMTVLHLAPGLHKSTLVRAAEARDCTVIKPRDLWLGQVAAQVRHITGKQVSEQELSAAAPWLFEDEE